MRHDDTPSGEQPAGTVEPLTTRYRRQAGVHASRRPPPALSGAFGGLSALLAGIGVTILGAEVITSGGSEALAALVAALYGAGGFALMAVGRGAHQAAGAAAAAVSVPLALGFVILGDGNVDPDAPTLVLALSTVAWAALHLTGPGRGRPLFLAAALAGAWLTVVVQVGLEALFVFTPFGGMPFFVAGPPDTAATTVVSLLFGVVYLWSGYGIHRSGLRGTATPFVGVGLLALAVGIGVGATNRDAWVPALLLFTGGGYAGFVGAVLGRRLTAWTGAAAATAGVLIFLVEAAGDSATAGGLLLAVVGAVAALATPWLGDALGENGEGGADRVRPPSPTPDPPPRNQRPSGSGRRERPLRAR